MFTAPLAEPYTGRDVYDFGSANDGDITRIDVHSPGHFAVPIVTDPATIRAIVGALRSGVGQTRTSTTNPFSVLFAMHRRDGAIVETVMDVTGWTGALQVDRHTATDVVNRYLHVDTSAAISSGGVAVVDGSQTLLYDDYGDQVSLVPTPPQLPDYDGPTVGEGRSGNEFIVSRNGDSYRLLTNAPPRAPSSVVPPGCSEASTAGAWTAALCGQLNRGIELVGPTGVVRRYDAPVDTENFWHPIASAAGRALFTHVPHDCGIPTAMILDSAHPSPTFIEYGTGLGWTRTGQALVAFDNWCVAKPSGVYSIDPVNGARKLIVRLPPPPAGGSYEGRVYRFTFAPGTNL